MKRTAADIESYTDRIATGAADDGIPWRMHGVQAEWLGRRYGVTVTFGPGEHKLRDVARKIAEEILG